MICPLCQSNNSAAAQRCRACGAPLIARQRETAPDALPAGTLLAGTYAVESVLGQGGFGITYRCHDRMLDRRVAVKEFFPSSCRRHNAEVEPSRGLSDANFREARAQFLAEARTLARCHHVGIVGVHAAFEANSTAYMVMELLSGKTLAQLLSARGGRMNEAEAVGIIERIGAALQFVHELDLLHRDIKPDNIIVCDDGRVMLIDFGTAREFVKDSAQGHTVVVTPGYAPLEQYAKQARRGAFTDVYSLAATLYHLLTGAMPPAASDRAMGVLLRPVREQSPQVSASVARAVESALQMEIAKRPQSVNEFLDLLGAPIEESEVESLLQPQLVDSPLDNDSSDALPVALAPDFLRAQQQAWQNVMPAANAQPVTIAPARAFPLAADPPTASPVAGGGAGGSVRVKDHANDSTHYLWWIFAVFIGIISLASLIVVGGTQRNATSPQTSLSSEHRPSFPNYSPPSRPTTAQFDSSQNARGQNLDELRLLPSSSVSFLPDGKTINLPKDGDWRGTARFSPDGQRLATINRQSVVRVLSLPDRRVVRSLALDKNFAPINTVFSADNQTVAVMQGTKRSASNPYPKSNRVSVWSVRTGKRLGVFTASPQEESVVPQAVLSESKILLRTTLIGDGKTKLFLWNPKTGKHGASPVSFPNDVEWKRGVASPDGKTFVTGDGTGRLRWLDLGTGKQKAQFVTRLTERDYLARFADSSNKDGDTLLPMWGIAYAPNGAYLASRNDAEISVFDANARKLGSLTISSRRGGWFAMSPDGKWVMAYGALPNGAMTNPPLGALLWNVETNQKIRLQSPSQNKLDFGFSPDGKHLYGVFAQDGRFQLVTWPVGAPTAGVFGERREVSFEASGMMMRPSVPIAQAGQLIAMATQGGVELRQQDGTLIRRLDTFGPEAQGLRFSPDGKFLAVRSDFAPLQLWDVKSGKQVVSMPMGNGSFGQRRASHDMAFAPDNTLFAYARTDGNAHAIELWDMRGQPRRFASLAQKEKVNAIVFSPDNRALICGDQKGLLQWIDVSTRQTQDEVQFSEPISDIAFAAQTLAVIKNSNIVSYQLRANSQSPLQSGATTVIPLSSKGSKVPLIQSAISADGELLATVRGNQKIEVWQLSAGSLFQSFDANGGAMFPSSSLGFSADVTRLTLVGRQYDERRIGITTWRRTK